MTPPTHRLIATVAHLRDLSPTVREFTLTLPPGPWMAAPGAHIELVVPTGPGPSDALLLRTYSLIDPRPGGPVRIAVKRMDQGRGGSRAMWQLQPGQTLAISPPQQHFSIDWDAPAHVLLAGGIGITPLLGMARQLSARGAPVSLLYGVASASEAVYAEPLRQWLGERLQLLVGQPLDVPAAIASLPPDGQLVVCGPVGLLQSAQAVWQASGRRLERLRFETVGAAPGALARPFALTVPRHGLNCTVPAEASLLDALQAQGIEVLSECRRGECGLCVLDVLALDGEIEHRDVFLSAADKAANRHICSCVSRVRGHITIDTAYRADRLPAGLPA